MLNQIFLNSNVIITFLDNLENAITFSKLGTIHPDILSSEHLKQLLNELSNYYDKSRILNLNLNSWYSIIKTNCYFHENKIIFAIEIPIVHPNNFQYFHLFPIPTENSTLIIPFKPYLALQKELYQYMEQPCEFYENLFICKQEELKSNPEEDCVASLIQNTNARCQQTPIEIPSLILNKVNGNHLLVISKEEIKVKKNCPTEEYFAIQGAVLIYTPPNCTVQYQNYTFENLGTEEYGRPLVLPKIQKDTERLYTTKWKPLKLGKIPLEDIHKLKENIDTFHQLSAEENQDNWPYIWPHWLITILCIFLGIAIAIIRVLKRRRAAAKKPRDNQKTDKTRNEPSVFFQPEVSS